MSSPSSSAVTPSNRCVLVSIDGWGLRTAERGNAILNASTPNMRRLASAGLYSAIDASGLSVGLPRGVMGNSEVGHLTMGAGRVSFQDLVRINESIADKSFFSNPTLNEALQRAKSVSGGRIHFLGLVSDGGVHSHIEHLESFLSAAKSAGVQNSFVHFFADGRDTQPNSSPRYIERLQNYMKEQNYGSIATLQGRYYAMDRDKRWERIRVALKAILDGEGEELNGRSILQLVEDRFKAEEFDEFLKPAICNRDGLIRDNDTLLFINFRSDRMREIVTALGGGERPEAIESSLARKNLQVIQMTQYDEKFTLPIVFPPQTMVNGLTEWLSKHGIRQFHTAETEKYAHVTFFFAGGREAAFPLEDREMIPSPKVATYDLQPEMSQIAVAHSVVKAIESDNYPFIMCNFAAPDMVGHTGIYDKAVIACEVCDQGIGIIAEACAKAGYYLIVTADHGNAEEMEDEEGKPKTSHTTNVIPIIVKAPTEAKQQNLKLSDEAAKLHNIAELQPIGGLSAVAPTVLAIMGLEVPKEMTGKSLIKIQ